MQAGKRPFDTNIILLAIKKKHSDREVLMWTRAELKECAKAGLEHYYGYGLLVTFLAGILGGERRNGINISVERNFGSHGQSQWASEMLKNPSLELGLALLGFSVALAVFAILMVIKIFVSNVVLVGKCRYFTISTLYEEHAGVAELFGNFKAGRYWNTVKVQFLRALYEALWTLLLVIPGIIKHYEYYMVPYLVAEYPDMDSREVFRLSKEMMDGNKLDTWVLELSFIGWYLLGLLICCVGMIFVEPYVEATMAELYLKLREERLGVPRNGNRVHHPDPDGAVYTQSVAPDGSNWRGTDSKWN